MLLKLREDARLDKDHKQLLVLSEYDPALAQTLLDEGSHFWGTTFYFVRDLSEVQYAIEAEMFDYLYAPLEKIGMIDRRLFKYI